MDGYFQACSGDLREFHGNFQIIGLLGLFQISI